MPTFLRPTLVILFIVTLAVVPFSWAQPPVKVPSETISIRVSEGTDLAFDISPDGRSIVFDLLGQLWLMPAAGGKARPITDAVRDVAEDNDPSFSPDGSSVVFRGERNGRTGLWRLDLASGRPRQLTQLPDPDGFDGGAAWSSDGKQIAFAHGVPPDITNRQWRTALMLLETASGKVSEVSITGIQNPTIRSVVWAGNGNEIAFTANGRIWIVPTSGGQAKPVTEESVRAQAPSLSSDGRQLAYFAPDPAGRNQIWVREIGGDSVQPIKLTDHTDVTTTRIRWLPDGKELLYSADGRLWRISTSGGKPQEIRFTADLAITRPRLTLPTARFPEPGRLEPARGFMGLALSPDGKSIGMLALGKLWIIPVGGSPRAVASVPFDANSLAWSADGKEVGWTAGVPEQADLFATDLANGTTRQVTSLPGREGFPSYSPDGRNLSFVHFDSEKFMLRVIDAKATNVADAAQTRSLGPIGQFSSSPQWSPESDGVLVSGRASPNQSATFVPLSGERQVLKRSADAPTFLQWTPRTITFVRHDRLWQAPFDRSGLLADPKPLGNEAAIYASCSRDGTVLFVSEQGLRLRSPSGEERKIGWPISYTPPLPEKTLVRNVQIIDGTGAPITAPRDILIDGGRIARIAPTGSIPSVGLLVIDGGGRVVMPGLMDLHAHVERPDLLPGYLYFGVTSIRDQGASMAPMVAYSDAMASGSLPGPRVGYGGFQYYSDWAYDSDQWQGIEPEADPEHIKRAVALSEAFGAQHIKTRTFRRWDINARMIEEAHRRGMRATGHCSHLLPLIAAGMNAKEHFGFCESQGKTHIYDDLVQLFRAANIGVVPTITYVDFAVRMNQKPTLLSEDAELAPFVPEKDYFGWMLALNPEQQKDLSMEVGFAREATRKLSRAGVTLGVGSDIWQIPTGPHMELEQMVVSGLTPLKAIHAGTGGSAKILGAEKDLGTIEVGKWADLIILDADPLKDIRNTRRIWQVLHNGQVIDRSAVIQAVKTR